MSPTILNLKSQIEAWEETLTDDQHQATAFERGMMQGELLILAHVADERMVAALALAIADFFLEVKKLASPSRKENSR